MNEDPTLDLLLVMGCQMTLGTGSFLNLANPLTFTGILANSTLGGSPVGHDQSRPRFYPIPQDRP